MRDQRFHAPIVRLSGGEDKWSAEPRPRVPGLERLVITLEEEMSAAAEELRFEYAAKLRDEIKELRRELQALAEAAA